MDYEPMTGRWRAGRYVGELRFENGVLRIEPRFGMPSLLRWLGEIWGVRLLDGGGAMKDQSLWLWLIIAHLWGGKLVEAAKHGLPYRRVDATHRGISLKGRLLPVQTALLRSVRDDHLVSRMRVKAVDRLIGEIVLLTERHLNGVLGKNGPNPSWLPERGSEILSGLRSALGARCDEAAAHRSDAIRYTPITEGYRPLVNLSVSILGRRPQAPEAGTNAKSYGLLLDMAEVWELYVARLIQRGLPDYRVVHSGRMKVNFQWLLVGQSGSRLQSLRPDIVITVDDNRHLAIVDAKYKNTRSTRENVSGVLREDLYQLAAYLSGFGTPNQRLDGFLVYPEDVDGRVTSSLATDNPWRVSSGHDRNLWFLSIDGRDVPTGASLSMSETTVLHTIHGALGAVAQTSTRSVFNAA